MRILIVLAHPDKQSFNHAIADTVYNVLLNNGHDIIFHDLYSERFDPLLLADEISRDAYLSPELQKHCSEIKEAEGIIIIHPNWWGQPPAILKGWVDRVIRPGVAYEFVANDSGEGIPNGLLSAKSALVFNTSNTETARENAIFGDPLEAIWKDCIFGLCGVSDVYRRMFNIVVVSEPAERNRWLDEVSHAVNQYYPEDI